MKQIYSALTAIAFFVSLHATAQFNQNFNTGLPSSSNCWIFNNIGLESAGINGASASATNTEAIIATPFLSGTSTSISFNYKNTSTWSGNHTKKIQIGYLDNANVFTLVGTEIELNKNSNTNTASVIRILPAIQQKRIAIKIISTNGVTSTPVLIDDILISGATPYARDFINDFVSTYPYYPITGNILGCLNSKNNEALTVQVVDDVQEGVLEFNADGSFTHTPEEGFSGGIITFTYRINYNGTYSNTGEVSLNYAIQTLLPVKLINFSGNVVNQRAELKWTLEANETGEFIQVEKSSDGKTFAPVTVVINTAKAGSENYSFTDASLLHNTAYYRLKMVNKTGTFSYSKIIVLKNSTDTKASTITVLRNPVQASIAFNYNSTETGVAIINVYNAAGLKMMSFQHTMHKGINSIDKPLPSNFNNGSYIMEVIKNNERSVVKLLK